MRMRLLSAMVAMATMLATGAASAVPPGDPIALESLRGKVVYLDFWASWCVPCRQSFPWMDHLQQVLGRDGLVVVAVNVDHERADADRFLRELAPGFRVAYDPEGTLAEQYHVHGMPTSFLIDREGKVQLQHAGFRTRDRDELEARIRTLLASH
jgi:cytochrome c biogenesis protein CcmG, thiol:disulfide interchange protein DsbE